MAIPGDKPPSDPPQDGPSVYRNARLLVSCPDRPGIVAAVSGFLFEHGANIVSSDQHSTDPEGGRFFMRMEFSTADMDLEGDRLEAAFERDIAGRFEMRWRMSHPEDRKRMAILVSRYEHCVLDLLWRWRRGSLDADVVLVASNHPDLEEDVRSFGVPYHHVPVPPDGKQQSEESLLELLAGKVDLVVLARYMQILSPQTCDRLRGRCINIHHSFLPSFRGPRPYHQAHALGVKLIGATAHYVVADLDAGPIIEQAVERVDHSFGPEQMARVGRDIENVVLARAVHWHVEHRVLANDGKTVVFK